MPDGICAAFYDHEQTFAWPGRAGFANTPALVGIARDARLGLITAVDTSVLLDVFGGDPMSGLQSAALVRSALTEGQLLACDVVWAESAAAFPDPEDACDAFMHLRVEFSPLDAAASLVAADAWRSCRDAGSDGDRVAADFLIGAHALTHADRLLTRDRGFYHRHFSELRVLDPSEPSG